MNRAVVETENHTPGCSNGATASRATEEPKNVSNRRGWIPISVCKSASHFFLQFTFKLHYDIMICALNGERGEGSS